MARRVPPSVFDAGVDGAVRRIGRGYDDVGRLQTLTSHDAAVGGGVVNEVKWTYGGWGNVVKSQQAHDGGVGTNTAAVEYSYDDGVDAYGNAKYVRLASVTYPSGRVVGYTYGSTGSASDVLSRVEAITDGTGTNAATLAQYSYLGAGTITSVEHPSVSGGLTLSYGSGGTYGGWDRFGRVVDQDWTSGTGTNTAHLDRFGYTYDRDSNRTSRTVTATGAPSTLDEVYGYDGSDRLTGVTRGRMVNGSISGSNVTFSQGWDTLDSLGNWRSFTQDADGAGTNSASITQARTHNAANETTAVTQSPGDWIDPTYDAAGNMTSGPKPGAETTRQHYTYDAWNRMVAVKADSAGSPGSTEATYEYDGQNRRVQRVTGGATYDSYFNEAWQEVETRKDGDGDPLDQYVWDLRYIDSPVVRFRDGNTDGDYADGGTDRP